MKTDASSPSFHDHNNHTQHTAICCPYLIQAVCFSFHCLIYTALIYRFLYLLGDDFSIIQQEIFMVKECTHHNIVAYFGSYLW